MKEGPDSSLFDIDMGTGSIYTKQSLRMRPQKLIKTLFDSMLKVVVPTLPDIDPAAIAASEKAGGMRYTHFEHRIIQQAYR